MAGQHFRLDIVVVQIENSQQFFVAAGHQVTIVRREIDRLHNVLVGVGVQLGAGQCVPQDRLKIAGRRRRFGRLGV